MKHIVRIMMFSLVCMTLFLVGCNQQGVEHQNKDSINVYFYNTQSGALEMEKVKVTLNQNATGEQKMAAVIESLNNGPQVKNQVNKPIDLHIKEYSLKEHIAYVNFKESYATLPVDVQVAIRVSLVYSLTDLEFVEAVEFSIENKPLATSYGTKVGPVYRKDILINGLIPNPPTLTQTITLYFAKANDDKLYKEERRINVNSNTPIEEYVIAELIKGPSKQGLEEGLIPTLPPDTKYNEIKTQELVCYVDLAYNLKNAQPTSPLHEKLMIYSLVNSLTEIPKVQKVIFLMDGKKQTEFPAALDTGGLFERNEEIIADQP